jgi:predicted membrane-bound mannosyltransferase
VVLLHMSNPSTSERFRSLPGRLSFGRFLLFVVPWFVVFAILDLALVAYLGPGAVESTKGQFAPAQSLPSAAVQKDDSKKEIAQSTAMTNETVHYATIVGLAAASMGDGPLLVSCALAPAKGN